jgi:DNA polymerase-1
MMLQVHDELVLEVPSDRVDEVVKIIDEKMEKIHKLCVPIKVDTEVGKNWQQLRSLY